MGRHTRHVLAGLIIGVALLTTGATRVSACSCGRETASCESTWTTDAVFVGTVVSIGPEVEYDRELENLRFTTKARTVRLKVTEAFRGVNTGELDIRTSASEASCGYSFQTGRTYVVYAHRGAQTDLLVVSLCSRTALVDLADDDLAYLRGPFRDSEAAGVIRGVATLSDPSIAGQPTPREPVGGVRIRLEGYSHITETTTGPDGAYEFRVPPGEYRLFAEARPGLYTHPAWDDGYDVSLRDVRACVVRIVTVRSDGRVTGRLLDANGRAVPLMTVELAHGTDPNSTRLTNHGRAFTDERGYFEFVQQEPGRYLLGLTLERDTRTEADHAIFVRPAGSDEVVTVELEPEMRVDVGNVRLAGGVAILPLSGVVVDASGAPVPGANVWVGIEPRLGVGSKFVVTGGGGEFRFNVVAGRYYRLYAQHPVNVAGIRQFRETRTESFEAVGRLKSFRLVLTEVR